MPRTVTAIPATLSRIPRLSVTGPLLKRRVAAYARVSTDHEDQLTSYEAQVDYYTRYIKNREDWEFVEIYADEGISGTSTARREGFKRMVADALSGRFDLLITKSVSRFARNTVDSLTTIRQMKEKNVECYFEKENIWTFDGKGELLLTIMSSLAQEESRSISENCTWGQRKRFADGRGSLAYSRFLGYDKPPDGSMVINEEQAETVRLIYRLFLDGLTPYGIAKELTARRLPTPAGGEKWSDSTVKSILRNEKYKGDALLQKTYTVDFLTKKKRHNHGEVQQYYVENSHPAIIAPDVFDMVQKEMERRKQRSGKYSGVDMLSAKIKCGQCGGWYGSKVWHSTDKYRRIVYQCNQKFKKKCSTPHLDERQVKELFVKAINRLITEKDEIIANLKLVVETLCDSTDLEGEVQSAREEVETLVGMVQHCIAENAHTAQSQEEYQKRYESLVNRYEGAKKRLENAARALSDRAAKSQNLQLFIRALRKQDGVISEFDTALWNNLLDYVTVYSKEDIRFTFKDGTEIKV